MSDDDIDLERVVSDPAYRREVIAFLNASADDASGGREAVRESVAAADG